MDSNLGRALKEVFGHEGGLSMIRSDPGNWTGGKVGVGQLKGTKYGIAANSYPHLDIRNLTLDQAAEIYRRDYWTKAGCDRLASGVDLAVFDLAVNSGLGRVRQLLPRALGGAATDTVKRLCALRLAFMRSLSTWGTFGKGWAKRVARIEAVGVRWALEAEGKPRGEVVKELNEEGTSAGKKGNAQVGGGVASGTAGGGVSTQIDPATFDWTAWIFAGGIVLVCLVVAAVLIRKALNNYKREKAYKEVAAEKEFDI